MNRAGGYISLHRQILDWEWFKDTNTLCLFIYLLLSANFTDTRFLGKKIKRGQVVTSLATMSEKTGLSVQNVKTALKHLILTGEVTNVSNRQYRIITIVKYDEYQKPTNGLTDQLTNNQQTTNKRLTNNQQYHNNDNKGNKENKGINKPLKGFTAPSPDEVRTYCNSVGLEIDADRFCDFYGSNGWRVGKNAMKDWRAAARNWARRDRSEKPTKPANQASNYSQRDYLSETEAALERMMSGEGF